MNSKLSGLFIIIILCVLSSLESQSEIRYHCEQDYVRVNDLIKAAAQEDIYGNRIVAAAKEMLGLPLGKASDNDSIGTVVVRLDSVNQRDFINYAIAAAKASYAVNPGIKDFEKALIDLSRKKGVDEGFTSQFLYGADWIVDNVYRGNLKEMTEYVDGGSFRTKTLDYVSRHKDEFPAMADSLVREKIKVNEMGFRSHRIPHLKKQTIGNKSIKELLKEGDIIMMLSPNDDLDLYNVGFVSFKDSEPYFIHISPQTGIVVIDEYPISRRFKIDGQYFYGYRWLRPIE